MYKASLMDKWDYQNGIDFAVKKEREKAIKEEKGHIAKSMKEDGTPVDAISKYTGLSFEEINKL